MGFELGNLGGAALTLGVAGLIIAFTLQIQGDVRGDMTENTSEYNATTDSIDGVSRFSAKLPIIATVVVAVFIIGLLVRGWGGMGR